ncbi:MAG: polyamine aminopropyltransferase [Thermodesulfovibrionales bacterium]|nr:polyamine aminopropyltransferase [Thermodesulfovibrionales bacterium]
MNSKWFVEKTTPYEGSYYSIDEILYSGRSQYQNIEVIISKSYGKMLILDNKIQSTELDEFIYHEALIHPAMMVSINPERVLIAGGGEGATAREILRYDSIKQIDIVDLDSQVIEVAKKHLSEWHRGSFDSPKINIYYDDAREYLKKTKNKYDLIIADLPEPFEDGPAMMLYTKEFYKLIEDSLMEKGVFVTQATSMSVNNLKVYASIISTLKTIFPIVRPYSAHIPSFYHTWGFALASRSLDPLLINSREIDEKISKFSESLKFYDSQIHKCLFTLPKYINDIINNQHSVITDNKPLSFY